MSEQIEVEYPEEVRNCHNCIFFKQGNCTANKEPQKIDKPLETCPIGLYEPIDVKTRMKGVYELITATIDYYMDIPEETKNIITLWIMGSHFHEKFDTYPYLFINAMRGSGKTRLLKIINTFAKDSQLVNSLTESVMFRTIGTLCIDEFEGVGGKDSTHLRELLNSAYKKGTKVMRMKKTKNLKEEGYAVEEFEPYRPIVMANIWGMEEVLGDRCITTLLEKSIDLSKIKLVENFTDSFEADFTKKTLESLIRCSLCSVHTLKNMNKAWNNYIKEQYQDKTTPIYTTTLDTVTTLTTYAPTTEELINEELIIIKDNTELFKKIDETQIDGRNLELFFPLFIIASDVGNGDILEKTLTYAKEMVKMRKMEEVTESKDVLVYSIICLKRELDWYNIKDLTEEFRLICGGGEDNNWINAKWMGRALKRLNLISDRRRIGRGIQVMLDIKKAKAKEEIFRGGKE